MEKPAEETLLEKPPLAQPAEDTPLAPESLQEAQVLADTIEDSLEAIMEDEALKKAKKEAFLESVTAAQKKEEAFQACAENCLPLLTPAHQAEAASVKLTGLGSCSRCRWGTGCSSCTFPHACRFHLRDELGKLLRPMTRLPPQLLQGGGLLSDV